MFKAGANQSNQLLSVERQVKEIKKYQFLSSLPQNAEVINWALASDESDGDIEFLSLGYNHEGSSSSGSGCWTRLAKKGPN